jgi:hypothetical protein
MVHSCCEHWLRLSQNSPWNLVFQKGRLFWIREGLAETLICEPHVTYLHGWSRAAAAIVLLVHMSV